MNEDDICENCGMDDNPLFYCDDGIICLICLAGINKDRMKIAQEYQDTQKLLSEE